MRTTIDLSDDLHRRIKAEAAMRGRKLKDLVEEALRRSLAGAEPETAAKPASQSSFDELMQDCRGIASDVPPDFATDPKFLEGFGR